MLVYVTFCAKSKLQITIIRKICMLEIRENNYDNNFLPINKYICLKGLWLSKEKTTLFIKQCWHQNIKSTPSAEEWEIEVRITYSFTYNCLNKSTYNRTRVFRGNTISQVYAHNAHTIIHRCSYCVVLRILFQSVCLHFEASIASWYLFATMLLAKCLPLYIYNVFLICMMKEKTCMFTNNALIGRIN